MAVSLWRINGLPCALAFIAKMHEYDQADALVPEADRMAEKQKGKSNDKEVSS